MKKMTFVQAINDALCVAMRQDPKVIFYGLGANDPKRLFGSAVNLAEEFGPTRVFDMPTAENAMTGVAVGAALGGYKPVMTHLRLDFLMLAMDQLINSAAKWYYMFGGEDSAAITVRVIMGRGWGQGPTHSQCFQSLFAHIPGLRVVTPTFPADAKGLLLESIADPNPVIFFEHRWLHNQEGDVPEGDFRLPLDQGKLLFEGDDVTIVAMSLLTIEAFHAVKYLKKELGIGCDLIDLRSIKPIDWPLISRSVKKTGRLIALDLSHASFGVASEIISYVSENHFDCLKCAPQKMAGPDFPTPTSFGLSASFYFSAIDIARKVLAVTGREGDVTPLTKSGAIAHDVPGHWFSGPF